mmetsp:Transcript_11804/g.22393  ORF Transcript_11804/g.22393 Transcript_11804/m.22393 type:complete len:81 (-) Transcript_11804:413-655(-)
MPASPSSSNKDGSTASSAGKEKDGKKDEELSLDDLAKGGPSHGESKWGEMSIQDIGSLRPDAGGEGAWGETSIADLNLKL